VVLACWGVVGGSQGWPENTEIVVAAGGGATVGLERERRGMCVWVLLGYE